ncbi:MAG: hypothetical protein QOF61_1045 [Acidobacteriota bacterium]|jgi:hypothetical protein|nr:hypothetical protein [Acidobacteriota bacterium]
MLFIQSNDLALCLSEGERLRLLDALASRGHAPLVRTARRRTFELLAPEGEAAAADGFAAALERQCAARRESMPGGGAYTPGDLFSTNDCVFFVVFGARAAEGVSAGIVYSVETAEPLANLERFCRDVRESLVRVERSDDEKSSVERSGDDAATDTENARDASHDLPGWKTHAAASSHGLARFIAIQPTDFAVAAKCKGGAREFMHATELMENQAVRLFLRRVQELRREGYTPRRLLAEAGAAGNVSVERMLDAGLLERELRVSCRKSGHALFDLPSPDSLAAITISRAKCSLCAAPIADEVVEEAINPTWLAVTLLEDGTWLSNRVYKLIRALGVPDSEIATGPASPHGESYIAAEVCGNSFLFVTRDGDLTPAFARRVVETVAETEATHLVVITTRSVEEEGRLRLYEYAWRRARDGEDLSIALVEGLGAARREIERAFERAIHHELSRRLFTLDAALGFGASDFVLDWFKLASAKGRQARALMPLFSDLDQRVAS